MDSASSDSIFFYTFVQKNVKNNLFQAFKRLSEAHMFYLKGIIHQKCQSY